MQFVNINSFTFDFFQRALACGFYCYKCLLVSYLVSKEIQGSVLMGLNKVLPKTAQLSDFDEILKPK